MNAYQDDIHLLTGAYAVDALDELERARFEAHLAVCHDCRTEVAGLVEAAGLLAETTAVPPRPELREQVLAGIQTVRPLPPVVTRVPPATSTGGSRRAPRRWFPLVAVAAALTLIAGVGATVWQSRDNDDTSQVQLTAAEQVLGAPDREEVSLTVKGADMTVVRSKSEDGAVLVAKGMPAAPSGKVYELWLRDAAGHLERAGLLPDGSDHTVLLKGDTTGATGVGITVEPDGGSDVPTSTAIAMFELT